MWYKSGYVLKNGVNAKPMDSRPDDDNEGQLTLDFYSDIKEVTQEMYIDLETKEYFVLHERAAYAYQIEQYESAISQSLK